MTKIVAYNSPSHSPFLDYTKNVLPMKFSFFVLGMSWVFIGYVWVCVGYVTYLSDSGAFCSMWSGPLASAGLPDYICVGYVFGMCWVCDIPI